MAREIKALLDEEIAAYAARNPRSQAMFARAVQSLPGGNTRTGIHIDPFPLYADRGEGAYLYDIDGHRLIDFVNNNTALPLGHAHPAIVTALQKQIALGTGFSRPLALEVEMAEMLRARMPALEKMRFCSSGTEAVLNALRVARAHTGRTKIAKFEGAYHGIDDSALVSYLPPLGPELGPASKPQGVASSAGLMAHTLDEVVVLPFNDAAACAEIIGDNAQDLAAVIVDPLSTAAGLTLPEAGFLSSLREGDHPCWCPADLRRNRQLPLRPGRDAHGLSSAARSGLFGQGNRRWGRPAQFSAAAPTPWTYTIQPTGRRSNSPEPSTPIPSP